MQLAAIAKDGREFLASEGLAEEIFRTKIF
jgi:hypothetical protein